MKQIIYKNVIDSLKDIIITVYDKDFIIKYVSNAIKLDELNQDSKTDSSIGDIIGKKIDEVYEPSMVVQYSPYWKLAIEDECPNTIIAYHNRRYWLQKFLPVYDSENTVVAGMVIAEDITKSYLDSKSVKQKEKQIQEMSKIASHDIRSPIATLLGLLNLLDEELLNHKNTDDLAILLKNVRIPVEKLDRIVRLINKKANEIWNDKT
jgi:signal transduction histidine kinase